MDEFLKTKFEELKMEMEQKQEEYEEKIKILEEKINNHDQIISTNSNSNNSNNVQNNIQNNMNNSHNNTTNNQYNITINSYGNEDISKITSEMWDKIISTEFEMIPNLIEEIHINTPENRNLYLANNKEKFALILQGENWKLIDKKDLITTLIMDKTILLESIIHKEEGNFNQRRAEIALKHCKHDEDEIESVKKNTMLILLNNNNLIRKTYEENYNKKITLS